MPGTSFESSHQEASPACQPQHTLEANQGQVRGIIWCTFPGHFLIPCCFSQGARCKGQHLGWAGTEEQALCSADSMHFSRLFLAANWKQPNRPSAALLPAGTATGRDVAVSQTSLSPTRSPQAPESFPQPGQGYRTRAWKLLGWGPWGDEMAHSGFGNTKIFGNKALHFAAERKSSFSFWNQLNFPSREGIEPAAGLPRLGKNIPVRPDLAAQHQPRAGIICKYPSRENPLQQPLICEKHHKC